MPALYSLARALVFPSRYESFGIPIVEAMASGCPVVTATTSACPEVAGDAALLVDPDDVEGLAVAIQRVSLDDALREDLRQRGLRRAVEFSWSASASTLLAELEAAAVNGRAARARSRA
jgi:glycosyltransferase involved in cell wall biosynthesis